jgi:hypothetical protein
MSDQLHKLNYHFSVFYIKRGGVAKSEKWLSHEPDDHSSFPWHGTKDLSLVSEICNYDISINFLVANLVLDCSSTRTDSFQLV